ncbi:MAG TPA: serine/threonine-protein kinase [Polyangiaceae bacterium]|nr:serine/threonine-protein kinase [Polyangiaceae bacterium]
MTDQPGRVLAGKYELVEQIGRGGMAVVWRGMTHGANGFARPIAIKRIESQVIGFAEVVEMFVEEARVGALLNHPNIVQVFDFGQDEDGHHFLVTELVNGLHLGQWVKSHFERAQRETPWALVAAIGIEMLRGLEAAHSRKGPDGTASPILHRDVTPPNILLDLGGIVKLADFGLARAMDRGRMTRPNIVKGKLSYLAPELIMGDAPSPASDLFSVGIVLWEALTGERLFNAGTDVDVVAQIREAKVPMLSMKRRNLPMALTSAVHRALEKDPARRFRTAREMLEALTEVLRVLPESTDAMALGKSVREAQARLATPG